MKKGYSECRVLNMKLEEFKTFAENVFLCEDDMEFDV